MQLHTLHTQTLTSKHGAWREHSDRATNWVVVLAIKMPREIAGTLPQMKALGVCHECWTEISKAKCLQVMLSAYTYLNIFAN
jgi:hypothetical protein